MAVLCCGGAPSPAPACLAPCFAHLSRPPAGVVGKVTETAVEVVSEDADEAGALRPPLRLDVVASEATHKKLMLVRVGCVSTTYAYGVCMYIVGVCPWFECVYLFTGCCVRLSIVCGCVSMICACVHVFFCVFP